jgi:CO/xanthine dehydrogenase Mo-binding subunit
VKLAADRIRNRLMERAAAQLGISAVAHEGGRFVAKDGGKSVSLAEVVRNLPEPIAEHVTLNAGSPDQIVNSFAAHFAEVEVELDSGRIRVLRYVAAHDAGRIVNPRLAEGQVTGGVLQFLGIALREELLLDPATGVTLNPSFLEHKSTGLVDFPPIEVIFAGEPDPLGPFGAKALGEPPVVPVFAAISNAVANATGIWLHETPFTPRCVLAALQKGGAVPV